MTPTISRASVCGIACNLCFACGPTWLSTSGVINFK